MKFLVIPALFLWVLGSSHGLADIPVPPQQSKPWTPPKTKLAPTAGSAIADLFNEGLADPRNCEYREFQIKSGIELDVKTHGWILPGEGKDRFAVAWNGLVYPVESIGPAANLEDDVRAMIAKDQKQWSSYTGNNRDVRGSWPVPEWISVSHENILPLKVAMLLRLGRADLAESLWNQWFSLGTEGKDDPYLVIAREWTDSLYNRALFAHLRGDDALSLASCRALIPIRSSIEASAARRGFPKDASGKPYFPNLQELPKLTADQERRALEQPYTPVLQSGQPTQGPERIAALIRDLEQVNARQMMNPGETDVSTDPIVHALIQEGDPAVEPLLTCFEEDNRLTRSEFTQGMQISPGPLIPVYEPAFVAIVGILKTPFSLSDSTDRAPHNLSLNDRHALAQKVRAYWAPYKGMTLPDRWYATLKDDHAGASAWLQAVENIVQPNSQTNLPQTIFGGGWSASGGTPANAPVVLHGESLRNKTNPSVSDLILKRYQELLALSQSDQTITFSTLGTLILALADWDGKTHLDDIRDSAQSFHQRFPNERGTFTSTLQTEALLFRKRALLGDPRALQDYADWLTSINPQDWNYFLMVDPFQIMWHYPTDPAIQKAADKIFIAKDSPWVPLTRIESLGNLLTTPLIGIAAFRQEVLRGLADQSPAGSIKLYDNGNSGFQLRSGYQTESSPSFQGDPLAPPAGSEIPIRQCDFYAYKLSRIRCFPAFELYWPKSNRDTAITAGKEFLQRYGDAFQDRPQDPYDDSPYGSQDSGTHLTLPHLDHPATADDVKQGHAIFSLSGTTRIWNLPSFPLDANRPSVKMDRQAGMESLPDGKTKTVISYTTNGQVWQAEEVLVDGKWQRFYGFEGRHQLEKVPASEIEFPAYGWTKISAWLDGQVQGPPTKTVPTQSYVTYSAIARDAPMPVVIKIHNRHGLDDEVPVEFLLPPGAKQPLPSGIALTLSYSSKIPPEVLNPPQKPFDGQWFLLGGNPSPPFDYGTWEEVPLRKDIAAIANSASVPTSISAASEADLLKVDLHDLFDMNRPGSYRLAAIYKLPGQSDAKSNEVTFSITDAH